MKWALSFGRFIVILTETIALLAFLYRFSLDRELVDIHDKIKQKQSIVKLLKANEDKFRSIQDSLSSIVVLTNTGRQTVTIFNDINDLASEGVSFNSIAISEETIRFDATIQSIVSLTNFVNKLKAYPKIQSVSLDKIENKITSATIAVGITATIKK